MSLRDYINVNTSITCARCGHVDELCDASINDAAASFEADGWREHDGDALCGECVIVLKTRRLRIAETEAESKYEV